MIDPLSISPERVREARRAQHLSQFRLAVKARLSPSTIAQLERAGYASPRTLRRVARALELRHE